MKIKRKFSVMIDENSIVQIDDRFLKVKIWLMHTGKNKNWSVFKKEVVEKALPTLYNIPILGYIKENPDTKELDFAGHEEVLIVKDGEYEWKYLGSAYGVIPESCNPTWETRLCDDGATREFLVVEGLMWNKFKTATDIIKAHNGKQPHSMEICEDYDGDWNEDDDFEFTDFRFEGACILGLDVEPAMYSSSIEVNERFSKMSAEISKQLDEYNKLHNNTNNKGNNTIDEQEQLNKLFAELNKTRECITGVSDEQCKTLFSELEKLNKLFS